MSGVVVPFPGPAQRPAPGEPAGPTAPAFSNRDGLRYGALAAPLAFAALPLYVSLPAHHAREFGLPLAALGALLLAVRTADALVDPWLGRLSDGWLAHSRARTLQAALAGALFLVLNKADPRQARFGSIVGYWQLYADDTRQRGKLQAAMVVSGLGTLVLLPGALVAAARPRRARRHCAVGLDRRRAGAHLFRLQPAGGAAPGLGHAVGR